MATQAEAETSEVKMDLTFVKRMTQEVNSYGFEDCVTPLTTWQINVKDVFKGHPKNASFTLYHPQFPTIDARYVARMTLDLLHDLHRWDLTLIVDQSEAEVPVEPFPLFLCKMYDGAAVPLKPKIHLPQNSFDCSATTNRLVFPFPGNISEQLAVFEIHQVSWQCAGSESTMEEAAVGKIERFREDMLRVGENEVLVMSPLFTFDPVKEGLTSKDGSNTKLYMMARFWYPEYEKNAIIEGLTVTLHMLNDVGQRGQLFEVVVTIFNQNNMETDQELKSLVARDVQEVRDLVVEIKCPPEGKESQLSQVFTNDMKNFVDARDTLYYKIRASLVQTY